MQALATEKRKENSRISDLRDRYENDGYIVFPRLIRDEQCDSIVASMGDKPGPYKHILQGKQEPIRTLAASLRVSMVLNELYGQWPRPFQTLNFSHGTEQDAHSDMIHFRCEPEHLMCGVWVALEDIHPDAGPLMVWPGSHRLPFRSMESFGLRPHIDEYPHYEHLLRPYVEESGCKPITIPSNKGDGIIWQANLVHGGAPISNHKLTRYSQVTHYFFEGSHSFTTPVMGCEREPEWIT